MGFFEHRNYKESVPLGFKYNKTVALHCPNNNCHFYGGLPLKFIDEDLYDSPPTVLIGTVDKFAAMALFNSNNKSLAKTLFGYDIDGNQTSKPPSLIIQDEFHLISGPLGTMAGYFEILIEKLISDFGFKPKIICSTATIKNFENQIKYVFGRRKSRLSPPPGITMSDSFFGYQSNKTSKIYLGIMSHKSKVSQSMMYGKIVASTLLNVNNYVDDNMKDYYWSLISYFNSIANLSSASGYLKSDYKRHMTTLSRSRDYQMKARYYNPLIEITGRTPSELIPQFLKRLENNYDDKNPKDSVTVCLASNIIEVGMDIQRLSLMLINRPPKSVSQYVQVSGRIGRDKKAPGLVLFYLDQNRPRDVSIYETFKSFHDRIYSDIEINSVTPFTDRVVNRLTASIMIAYARTRLKSVSSYLNVNDKETVFEYFKEIRNSIFEKAKLTGLTDDEFNKLEKNVNSILDSLIRQINILSEDPDEKNQISWSSGRDKEGVFYAMDDKKPDTTPLEVVTSVRDVSPDSKGKGYSSFSLWDYRED